ncbi:MAG TPA: phosphoglycerate dehydrogenase [Vicinamibacterales bacterium]|nr:phosphoglycerate dehydrogenase [Vicinamibacterales bacterium]
MEVLITCQSMVAVAPELEESFRARGLNVTAPVVQAFAEQELRRLVPRFDGWILGDEPATADVLEAGRRGRLRAAVKWGIGVDNVDFAAAARLGIPIVNTPGMFGDEVADMAMAYITGLARATCYVDREVRTGNWPRPRGISLSGKVVGLVGFGQIGRAIARRLLTAGMTVQVYDPAYAAAPGLDAVVRKTWPDGIDDLDFVVLACALTPENVHLLGAPFFARVKPGVRVVNVARGRLIDEAALVQGLSTGRVHSAALDVFEVEPLPLDSPLRTFERCIFGSHNCSNTNEAVLRASTRALDLLCDFLRARPA